MALRHPGEVRAHPGNLQLRRLLDRFEGGADLLDPRLDSGTELGLLGLDSQCATLDRLMHGPHALGLRLGQAGQLPGELGPGLIELLLEPDQVAGGCRVRMCPGRRGFESIEAQCGGRHRFGQTPDDAVRHPSEFDL